MKLKRIGIGSVVRIAMILYGLIGLIVGGILAVMSVLGAAISQATGAGRAGPFGILFGVGAIFFMPVLYALFGGVMVAVVTWLYNLLAGAVGGVELDLEP